MKIAYLIMAHKEFELLSKTIKCLQHPDIDVIIHFDLKAVVDINVLTLEFKDNPNVYYLENRINLNWGGSSILNAQINLLNAAVNLQKYDYVSFISGQDFSIKSNISKIRFFEDNKGQEFLEFYQLPSFDNWDGNGGCDRFEYFWLIDQIGYSESYKFYKKQIKEGVKRKLPNGLVPYGGSNWISITISCARYILSYIENHPEIIDFFSYVAHPEEIFFHTLILNSNFKGRAINNNLRYIDWKSDGPKPKVLKIEDLEYLKNTDAHFARKLELHSDRALIRELQKLN